MKSGFIIRDQFAKHFVTFTIINWVDVFSRKQYKDIIIESFKFCQENMGLQINGYVIMSNHLHAILQSERGNLSKIITAFKKYTGLKIIDAIQKNGESRKGWMLYRFEHAAIVNHRNSEHQFWVSGCRPMEVVTANFFWQKLDYIHQNPVKAGIVDFPEQYIYSSARNYLGERGVLEVDLVDWIKR